MVSDKILLVENSQESDSSATTAITQTTSSSSLTKQQRKGLNIAGPVQPYHPTLKNFWYPVAFSCDVKDDTMVNIHYMI